MGEDNLYIIRSVIKYNSTTHGFAKEFTEFPPEIGRWRTFGVTEKVAPFVSDFLRSANEGAKTARRSLQQYIIENRLDEVDALAKFAQSLMEFVISASGGSIPEIGGEVSVLSEERGKAIRWSAHSSACSR